MQPLMINIKGLFSDGLHLKVPHHEQKTQEVQARFQQWTQNEKSPIYSGYRKHLLQKDGLSQSKYLAEQLRQKFDAMVIVGIGGSALGAKTAISALQWDSKFSEKKTFVVDNLDPLEFERIWNQLDLTRTVFAIISKSGGTLETIAQLSVIMQRLQAKGMNPQKHLVAVTDPEKGSLKSWATALDIPTLDLPSAVGGRFSVLTPVGLLPMAFAGVDVDSMMNGALDELQKSSTGDLTRFGIRLAELEKANYLGHVMMPYSSFLKDFGAWFVQLWGESLGKSNTAGMGASPIPVAALGDTDQHSLLQLMVEGAQPLISAFIRIEQWPEHVLQRPNVAVLPHEFASLSYATGKTFWEILNAQQKATAKVLAEKDRPYYEIAIKELNAEAVGRLFALYMDLVVMTAAAHDVNPFDQPGVERGKKILPEILMG